MRKSASVCSLGVCVIVCLHRVCVCVCVCLRSLCLSTCAGVCDFVRHCVNLRNCPSACVCVNVHASVCFCECVCV